MIAYELDGFPAVIRLLEYVTEKSEKHHPDELVIRALWGPVTPWTVIDALKFGETYGFEIPSKLACDAVDEIRPILAPWATDILEYHENKNHWGLDLSLPEKPGVWPD
ncbi:hypothetical protein ACYCEU_08395 [Actinotignum timonense]|uniref:hypothetical protein n=1 Tax=Actinotignum TaxID=1653174 RepID=UPI00040C9426|nr:hypothetical protein [Actinotignum schaalii]AIE83050.1 hypothetical protein FB03_07070 [Actinotignum schaalii]WQN45206.1 hypothetical protein U4A90_00485 [Actinotignum schaalii]